MVEGVSSSGSIFSFLLLQIVYNFRSASKLSSRSLPVPPPAAGSGPPPDSVKLWGGPLRSLNCLLFLGSAENSVGRSVLGSVPHKNFDFDSPNALAVVHKLP